MMDLCSCRGILCCRKGPFSMEVVLRMTCRIFCSDLRSNLHLQFTQDTLIFIVLHYVVNTSSEELENVNMNEKMTFDLQGVQKKLVIVKLNVQFIDRNVAFVAFHYYRCLRCLKFQLFILDFFLYHIPFSTQFSLPKP